MDIRHAKTPIKKGGIMKKAIHLLIISLGAGLFLSMGSAEKSVAQPGTRLGLVTGCSGVLPALRNERTLGCDLVWEHLGIGLRMGLGAVPLRPLEIRRLLRMDVDSRVRVGSRMGELALRWRLLRMGA